MRTTFRRALVAITGALLLIAGIVPAQAASNRGEEARSEHQRIVDFWTPARVAQAVPRDFEFDPATGRFRQVAAPARPAARPGGGGGGGGGGSTSVLGASWTAGGSVQETTGKVLFALGANYYVCSASVIPDADATRSLVLTAAHCAYDETKGQFATNWMFIPNYDAAPVTLTTNGSFCTDTKYGCWTASALVVDSGFAAAGSFNTQATLHDWAIAVVGAGGKGGSVSPQLDTAVGTQSVSFASATSGADTYLFGYPAAGTYNGKDLVYSRGQLGRDPLNGKRTYRVASDMTGGCSGGPWFTPFNTTATGTGKGTQISVNSYGYSGQTYMHGPVFNDNTKAVYNAATSATSNTIVTAAP